MGTFTADLMVSLGAWGASRHLKTPFVVALKLVEVPAVLGDARSHLVERTETMKNKSGSKSCNYHRHLLSLRLFACCSDRT